MWTFFDSARADAEKKMRVVLAGAAGFIGSHMARRLLVDGHEVVGVDNLSTGQQINIDRLISQAGYRFVWHDVTEPLAIDGPVDLVADLACPASPVDFGPKSIEIMRVCSEGVLNLLKLALEKNAVFLHTSTSEVYGDPLVSPQDEEYWGNVNPIGPRGVYDEGKRYAEALIMAWHHRHGVPVRLSRIFNTYGPHMRLDDGRVVTNFICQALCGKPLTLHGKGLQTRSFCYVDDQVDGQLRLAASDYVGPVNLGNTEEITVRQLAEEIIELTGSSSELVYMPGNPDDPKVRKPDIALARRLLGWVPRISRKDGLLRTTDYCRLVLGRQSAGRPAFRTGAPNLAARKP